MVNISILNFQRFISLLYFFIKFTPTSFISITAIVEIITKKRDYINLRDTIRNGICQIIRNCFWSINIPKCIISVLEWLVFLAGCKIGGIAEYETRESINYGRIILIVVWWTDIKKTPNKKINFCS